ncbi:helix-turn-helix transcriptional regulator [Rhodobacter sp. NTK016B]|uniref:winged helix-turn-helix transcriptional regulator n=1 Tax=Rhodobacter sp. NTK016B TaxID=2759676 RepID=UPI001A909B5C|nr:helix-turn-helix domain-containing protein [Rhodobacter sp. NTK016B]MBN8290682.1 helix-turn-helix transcriptional regulator [Rhodobacter sp. NTK016B]
MKDVIHNGTTCQRINDVLARVGDRWSMLVVYALRDGPVRFNTLKRELGISQRMLSLTLRNLERDGLVLRHYYPEIPPRVEYELTPLGHSLREPVRALTDWALAHLDHIDAARESFDAGAAADTGA